MPKKLRSFRSQMLFLFGLSMLISGMITYAVYKVLQSYYRSEVKLEDPMAEYRAFIGKVGDVNFFLILFIPLSVMFFYFLTKRYARYFQEISAGIHRLASGDFHYQMKLSSRDEFGQIAADINQAGIKLREAVERGDFAESSKDQLVLNLAHDLRTPLTSVIGYLDFILRDEQLTTEQARHYTRIAFTKSQRLEKLVDELFEITRMNYGMLTIDSQPIDLSELLTQLEEEVYPMLESNHLTGRWQVEPHLPILGDGELLARVLENLLANAIRYGRDGEYVDINGYFDGEEAVVQIINYGDQIPPYELPHIFEMFYTGDESRTYHEGSTGLGLFIAKNIVNQHAGSITAQSDIVRTVFEVRLPREVPS
ncbi:ATP-binding protein [Paenibacillus sp. GCM10027626]|uniref:sensor histidine kinase n=1 Tax=Paenibacillus sp. GCM10027626 TaxID=3273411 RepID=UPI003628C97E